MVGSKRNEVAAAGVVERLYFLPLCPVDVLELLVYGARRPSVDQTAHIGREEALFIGEIGKDRPVLFSVVAVRAQRRVEVHMMLFVELRDPRERRRIEL